MFTNKRKYQSGFKQTKDVGVGWDAGTPSNYSSVEGAQQNSHDNLININLPRFEQNNSCENISNKFDSAAIEKIDKAIGMFANSQKSRDNTEFRSWVQPRSK